MGFFVLFLLLFLIGTANAGEQTFEIILITCDAVDVNGDGLITLSDLEVIKSHFGEPVTGNPPYDVCRDGVIDIFDAVSVSRHLVLYIP